MPAARIGDIAEEIVSRLNVYAGALQADMKRIRARHGEQPVAEALELIAQRGRVSADAWDAAGHAERVRVGILKVMHDHHHDEDLPAA